METIATEKKTGLYWLWLSVSIIIVDQITKYLVTSFIAYGETVYLMPYFNLTLAYNRGAAFNFMAEQGHLAIWLFVICATIISLLLCIWLRRLSTKQIWLGASLALILGGAIGNLLDRLLLGYVIDFFHFHIGLWSFPIFNVADIAITAGAIMLIIDIFKRN